MKGAYEFSEWILGTEGKGVGPLVPDKVGQVLIVLDSTYNTQIIILLNEYGSYMEKTAANTKMKFSFHFVLVLAMLRLFCRFLRSWHQLQGWMYRICLSKLSSMII